MRLHAVAVLLAAACGSSSVPEQCGNGTLDPGELCDAPAATSCSDLAGAFSAGQATCRSDCRGWDPSPCTLAEPAAFETVKPAERDPRWAEARCNDGTPFAFAVRLAPTPSDDWIIYLQGGVFCDDNAFACDQRDARLTSSLPLADRALGPIPAQGLLGADPAVNPDFAGANQVWAHYCSSDFWAGDTTTLRPTSGGDWYFSGHASVDAMLAILAERYGLDEARPALRVLFGGGSAGAFGAHLNIARVLAALPHADVELLVNAGWMTDWDDPAHRLGAATTSDREVWTRARAFWGARFDPACEAAAADPVDCIFGPVWYPLVAARLPVFIQQSPIDASFTRTHGFTADEDLSTWRAQVEASLAPVTWLFSGAVSYHTLGTSDDGLALGPSGATFAEAVGRFWHGQPAARTVF